MLARPRLVRSIARKSGAGGFWSRSRNSKRTVSPTNRRSRLPGPGIMTGISGCIRFSCGENQQETKELEDRKMAAAYLQNLGLSVLCHVSNDYSIAGHWAGDFDE